MRKCFDGQKLYYGIEVCQSSINTACAHIALWPVNHWSQMLFLLVNVSLKLQGHLPLSEKIIHESIFEKKKKKKKWQIRQCQYLVSEAEPSSHLQQMNTVM